MGEIQFLDQNGSFRMDQPENYSYLYFPIAGEQGLKASLTPNLGGDSKLNQNAFVLEPVSAENLHNNRTTRNFWCYIRGEGYWSVTGVSASAEASKFTDDQDESSIEAGFMWHKLTRKSAGYKLEAEVTSFVPVHDNVEVMRVSITNQDIVAKSIVPIAAIPLYGRSADNIRDHRHVTSLLHRISCTDNGVFVKPTLSFDERGHQKNQLTYYVAGFDGEGNGPESFFPTVDLFLGEGGTWLNPLAVRACLDGVKSGSRYEGKEAVGGLRFSEVILQPGERAEFIVLIGVTTEKESASDVLEKYNHAQKADAALETVKAYWTEKVNVSYHTGDEKFDHFMKWVSFQPILRRIYGCSFLPHHDYGKGGRGWRDLWQDCLALLIMNPDGVRQMILDNYGGVRMDGTNATIIGTKQGEFIADRNNITRVWMDHGFWPFLTTMFYLDQTGDMEILEQKVSYFKDAQVERGTAKDTEWKEAYGMKQRCCDGSVYMGSVLEHILLQNLCAFYEVGDHNEIRLRGADWNDALDMAWDKGESVAFTCAYAGNLRDLARVIRAYRKKTGKPNVELAEEILPLLGRNDKLYEDISAKRQILQDYSVKCRHSLSGEVSSVSIEELATNLEEKSRWMMENIRKQEWVKDAEGNGWFNGYYDNHGRKVEGVIEGNVRMMLTGQVFSVMSTTADDNQVAAIAKSADKYLYEKQVGGYRLNTDFKEEKYDMGRMFGFSYGDKENGAVFSHMTVMYANALYKRGFAMEGYKALHTLYETAMDFSTGKIYPGIPEYFNGQGRGMYHYLTGAASWYMLTVITRVFGVRGEEGDLVIAPALMPEQFDAEGNASLEMVFAGKKLRISIRNPHRKGPAEYRISKVKAEGRAVEITDGKKLVIGRDILAGFGEATSEIEVILGE